MPTMVVPAASSTGRKRLKFAGKGACAYPAMMATTPSLR